jgi:hypothetical protein
MKTVRVNLGTYNKEQALEIRKELKRVKSFRGKEILRVDFKSRTYGNKNNWHDRSMPISVADKIAIYAEVNAENKHSINLDSIQANMLRKIMLSYYKNSQQIDEVLMNGFKGINGMSNQELVDNLIKFNYSQSSVSA